MYAVVNTLYGRVRGSVLDGVNIFKGIPFAAPPFGANRFRPPQPVDSWSGVRDALSYGPKTPQLPYPQEMDILPPELVVPGEDCLNLNIWSPALGSAGRPVMVWVPGGMFEYHGTGASPWYDGTSFARDGIVCVTISYRVGADGFLYLGEGNANRGLRDQVAALEWVQANIAAFGGDPGNVTIFGESAGAMSVGTLLSMPRAAGLFHRAIAQSGAAHNVVSAATAQLVCQRLAEKLDVEPTRDAFAELPVDSVLSAQGELMNDLMANPDPELWGGEVVLSMLPWQPAIDGEVIPELPLERIAAGSAAGIDLVVGTNTHEHRLFLV
ncbi:MAG TPA: carboxylesterase/lipase family protein, partial [Chloroflexi bacterium]|nr:carboxylesterase/lipase family protein [Chloroflexota bacterium]